MPPGSFGSASADTRGSFVKLLRPSPSETNQLPGTNSAHVRCLVQTGCAVWRQSWFEASTVNSSRQSPSCIPIGTHVPVPIGNFHHPPCAGSTCKHASHDLHHQTTVHELRPVRGSARRSMRNSTLMIFDAPCCCFNWLWRQLFDLVGLSMSAECCDTNPLITVTPQRIDAHTWHCFKFLSGFQRETHSLYQLVFSFSLALSILSLNTRLYKTSRIGTWSLTSDEPVIFHWQKDPITSLDVTRQTAGPATDRVRSDGGTGMMNHWILE